MLAGVGRHSDRQSQPDHMPCKESSPKGNWGTSKGVNAGWWKQLMSLTVGEPEREGKRMQDGEVLQRCLKPLLDIQYVSQRASVISRSPQFLLISSMLISLSLLCLFSYLDVYLGVTILPHLTLANRSIYTAVTHKTSCYVWINKMLSLTLEG